MFKIRKKKVLSELVLERYRVLTTKDVPTPVYHNLIIIFLILI